MKKKKTYMLVMVTIILVIVMFGYLISYIATRMSKKHTEDIATLYCNDTGYSLQAFESKWGDSEQYKLETKLGHEIPVFYFCSDNTYLNKTIILVHWHESNHKVMYPIAEIFLENGWNVVLYDQRAHGDNTAKSVTFGLYECTDLEQVVDFVNEKSQNALVGALGQSMGGATVAYYSGTEHASNNLDFAIIDSAYSAMDEEISWEITKKENSFLGDAITNFGGLFNKVLNGFYFSEVDVEEAIGDNEIPTLIMHSKMDNKCPFYMGEVIYESINHTKKEMITFDYSEHLFAFWDEKDRYIDSVFRFTNSYYEQ